MPSASIPLNQKVPDDDLEYHIVLANGKELDCGKEPVVILFGWGGCEDRYLSKYSEIYEEMGCTTLRCIVPTRILFPGKWFESRLQGVAANVITIMLCLKFQEHPLFFHAFSNGGSSIYNIVSSLIRADPDHNFQVKGCIFDSAPARIYSQNIVTGVANGVKSNVIVKYICALSIVSYIHAIAAFSWFSSLILLKNPSWKLFILFDDLVNEPNICPQLFLYSKSDKVCTSQSIEDFINQRRNKGVQVTSVIFEDSEHVKLMLSNKEQYREAVTRFIYPYLTTQKSEITIDSVSHIS